MVVAAAATGKKKTLQWVHVYVEHEDSIEKWVEDASRLLMGDYQEEGVYEGKMYFVRKESGALPRMFIYFSEYYAEWYIGDELGGSSKAWVDADPTKHVPQATGWLMRGTLPGVHLATPLRMDESVMMHEAQGCDHCFPQKVATKEKLPAVTEKATTKERSLGATEKATEKAPQKAAASKKAGTQWIYVYVEHDEKIEKWIEDDSRLLMGDYKESGVYEGKKYFVRQESGKPRMLVYWSEYYNEWYFAQTLGGTSSAWVDADPKGEVPAEKGWLMRGSLAGVHHNTPLRIKKESVIMHEVHVCEHCICAPCRCIAACTRAAGKGLKSVGSCFLGVGIASAHGSTYGVKQLEGRPKTSSCMEGLLTEMSCAVPISWAFEHTVDAWYRAFFIDGFCYTASYQRSITQTEQNVHYARLRAMYGGYTSRIAQELAYNEPIAQSIGDLLHISSSHAAEHAEWARKHPWSASVLNETGCHVPFHDALEHAIDHTHKVSKDKIESNRKVGGAASCMQNTCLAGLLSCLFCHHPKSEAVKPRSIEVKSRELTVGAAASPEQKAKAEIDPTAAEKELEEQYWEEVERRKRWQRDQQKQIEYEKQEAAAAQRDMDLLQPQLEFHTNRLRELEFQKAKKRQSDAENAWEQDSYQCKLEEADTSSKQVAADNESLKVQKRELERKLTEYDMPKRTISWNQDPTLKAKDKRIEELRAQLMKEKEANTTSYDTSQSEAAYRVRLQEMELSNAQYARQRQELEQAIALRRQQQAGQDRRVQELEAQYVQKMNEQDGFYKGKVTSLRMETSNAGSHRLKEKQDFENRIYMLGQEKGQIKQQYELNLRNMTQARADLEAQRQSLLAQLESTSRQDTGQFQTRQFDLEAQRQALEVQHAQEVQQLQMTCSAEDQRIAALEQKLKALEQKTQQEYAQLVQGDAGSQAYDRQLDEARIVIEELQTDTTRKDEKIRITAESLEQQRSILEMDIANLRQQLAALQSQPSEEQVRATEECQQITYIIQTERQQSEAQLVELENALMAQRQEIAALQEQLQMLQSQSPPRSQQSLSPGSEPMSPGMTRVSGQTRYMATRPPAESPEWQT
mmetsp:Transcript_93390/g.171726  ORF Transcript_93390/g.171726 Transcript_93390/m.171726 type:complete len:1085 (-) Transcript_93390:202-3456(-)